MATYEKRNNGRAGIILVGGVAKERKGVAFSVTCNMSRTLVYWIGNLGIPGKGPHYGELYDPNRTIGQVIEAMTANGLVERNKRVEMFKHWPGNVSKYDVSGPYWSHEPTLLEYVHEMGRQNGSDIQMACVFI